MAVNEIFARFAHSNLMSFMAVFVFACLVTEFILSAANHWAPPTVFNWEYPFVVLIGVLTQTSRAKVNSFTFLQNAVMLFAVFLAFVSSILYIKSFDENYNNELATAGGKWTAADTTEATIYYKKPTDDEPTPDHMLFTKPGNLSIDPMLQTYNVTLTSVILSLMIIMVGRAIFVAFQSEGVGSTTTYEAKRAAPGSSTPESFLDRVKQLVPAIIVLYALTLPFVELLLAPDTARVDTFFNPHAMLVFAAAMSTWSVAGHEPLVEHSSLSHISPALDSFSALCLCLGLLFSIYAFSTFVQTLGDNNLTACDYSQVDTHWTLLTNTSSAFTLPGRNHYTLSFKLASPNAPDNSANAACVRLWTDIVFVALGFVMVWATGLLSQVVDWCCGGAPVFKVNLDVFSDSLPTLPTSREVSRPTVAGL